MKKSLFLLLTFLLVNSLFAQKEITLDDIWKDYTFFPKSVPGFNFQNDGKHYTRLEEKEINQYDLTTGKLSRNIFSGDKYMNKDGFDGEFSAYEFSEDETKLLIETEREQIYRRSSRANFYVFDRDKKTMTHVYTDGKQRYATFSPDATKVAFVRGNDMYYKDLSTNKEIRITSDGKPNNIINGATDWVYEEEFSLARAFQWSPDGQRIAFMRFDESEVKEFTMTLFKGGLYPEYETFKYPKVGETNATVTVHLYDINTGKVIGAQTGNEKDTYFPRIKWTKNPRILCVYKMNRHQNKLELLMTDAVSGKSAVILKEENPYYIDITDDLTFLDNGKEFIWTSEVDGYNHIYLYNVKGKKVRQITKGKFDVTSFYGYDKERETIYYQAAEKKPMQREVYSIGLNGKNKKMMSKEAGTNRGDFSSTFDYFVNSHSSVATPGNYIVYKNDGSKVRMIEDNADLKRKKKEYGISDKEFFTCNANDGTKLNGWMIKPPNMEKGKKYPVFMYVYGGPGSQTVQDSWDAFNGIWFQMLAQKGYIVASVDNRGTGARGQEFKKMTYKELGKYETEDQIAAAKYLGGLDYADKDRIGIFGWSYGGYMSSLCIFKGNDVFKSAIAVAPVASWKWYDTIYTERYMRTEEENPSGYKDNSPVNFTDGLEGNYLLVHGIADDNVHWQNTVEMANALIASDKQFDTYFYPNRNHGIFGGNTRHHLYTAMTNFILEKL